MFQTIVDENDIELEFDIEHNDFSILLGDDSNNIFYFHGLSNEQMKNLYESLDKFFGEK